MHYFEHKFTAWLRPDSVLSNIWKRGQSGLQVWSKLQEINFN